MMGQRPFLSWENPIVAQSLKLDLQVGARLANAIRVNRPNRLNLKTEYKAATSSSSSQQQMLALRETTI